MDNVKIGKFISELRKEKNLTQKDLADKLFVSDRAVSKWECGKCMPDLSLLTPLGKELEVSVSELLAGEKLDNISKDKNDIIMKKSISNYKTEYIKKLFKRLIILFPIMTFGSIMIILTIGELSRGYVPFTNQNSEWDLLSFSQLKNRKLATTYLKAIQNSDYKTIQKIVYPADCYEQKSVYKYTEDLKILKEMGVKISNFWYTSSNFDELGFTGYYGLELEYKEMKRQITFSISTMNNKKISMCSSIYSEVLPLNQSENWDEILSLLYT